MSIDQKSETYQCDEIFGPYQKAELPYSYQDGTSIKNAEKDLKCWYIENPINKELVKQMTLRFGPQVEKEFIIVLKSPNNRMAYNITSFVTLKLVNLRRQSPSLQQ